MEQEFNLFCWPGQYVVVEFLFALYFYEFASKLQVRLSWHLILDEEIEGTWSSITSEETFREVYQNIPYPNPIRL